MNEYRIVTREAPLDIQMLNIRQIAEMLGVHENTVRRLVASGKLAGYRISARGDLRFELQDVRKFLAERRTN